MRFSRSTIFDLGRGSEGQEGAASNGNDARGTLRAQQLLSPSTSTSCSSFPLLLPSPLSCSPRVFSCEREPEAAASCCCFCCCCCSCRSSSNEARKTANQKLTPNSERKKPSPLRPPSPPGPLLPPPRSPPPASPSSAPRDTRARRSSASPRGTRASTWSR